MKVELIQGEVLTIPPNSLVVLPLGTPHEVANELATRMAKLWKRKDIICLVADDVKVMAAQGEPDDD